MTDIALERPVEGDDDYMDKEAPLPDGRPNIHAKHLSVIITAGTEDRDRSIEEFHADILEAVAAVPGVKRVMVGGSYYILDGKVCLPGDYDPQTQNFKPDTYPPPWAGGPQPKYERPPRQAIGRSPAEPRRKDERAVVDGMSKVAEALAEAQNGET